MDQPTATERALELPPGRRGKSEAAEPDEDAKPIKLRTIKEEIGVLMRLHVAVVHARQAFNAKAEGIGGRANVKPALLRRLVRVSYAGKFAADRRELERAGELFDGIGEVPGNGDG